MSKTALISINTSWNIYHFRAGLMTVLRTAGYRIVSAAPKDAYTQRLAAKMDCHITLPMDNAGTSPLNDMLLFFRYYQLLRREKPSVLLTYTIKPNIYGALAARMLGIPVIANVSGLGTAFIREGWLTRIVCLLYRVAFRHVACVFFQNPEDRRLFIARRLVAAEQAHVLPGSGVDLAYFSPRPLLRAADAPLTFVLIARLLWDKGIGEYVAAARIVKAAHPGTRFRLVGPRAVRNQTAITDAQIDAWVAEGVIDYLGEIEDVRDVMAAHDCVVLPSYREGMSRVLLEAAAMGKPIIATDVVGCHHVVDHEKNGLVCQVRNAANLAETMERFIAFTPEQRAQMGIESRAKAVREFDESQVFSAYLAQLACLTTA